ncbi:MAG: ABC transporter [Candidatus Aminicenantes bacterium RBG_13_63_10]|nr:MAG: ABC transporter [Candidatus Aminicenantes bacterium RBG_13_63_10]
MDRSSATALQVLGLAKAYKDVRAVDGLSFEVRRGEIFGFLGPNGAGKTTTIKMMCGLLRPDAGTITVNGAPVRPGSRGGLKAVGLSPQTIVIWETLTCREQLEFMGRMYGLSRTAARAKSGELLDAFGLRDKRDKLGKTLSGGMQRRLNIALALVHDPEILFLDEPQAGLDPQSRVLVRDHIRGLAEKTTVVLTTHDMEEAEKLSDRVCIIDRGKLLVLDTVAGVKNRLGRGDVVEVQVAEDIRTTLLPFVPGLRPGSPGVSDTEHTLSLVSDEAARILPEILQVIKTRSLALEHVRVRAVTLEDVFIQLTGRGLRE